MIRHPLAPLRTTIRNVSRVQPLFCAIERIAADCELSSCSHSKTFRTARSRTSGQYLLALGIPPSSQQLGLRQSLGGSGNAIKQPDLLWGKGQGDCERPDILCRHGTLRMGSRIARRVTTID